MRANMAAIDVVMPQWLQLTEQGVVIDNGEITRETLHHIRAAEKPPLVMPMIINFSDGEWHGDLVARAVETSEARGALVGKLLDYVRTGGFAGITIDMEDLDPETMPSFELFMEDLYRAFHAGGLAVNLAIPITSPQWRAGILARSVDALIVMAYDQHAPMTVPGPVAAQGWFEAGIQARIAEAGADKIVVGFGNYGYDWREGGPEAEVHGFRDVMLRASQAGARIRLDLESLNPTFEYRDIDNEHREVWFLDGVTAFNQIQAISGARPRGVALWRLGSEDASIWKILADPARADPEALAVIGADYEITYQGEGEILKVVSGPQQGSRAIRFDPDINRITSAEILSYPSSYEIARWGARDDKLLVLTFDDGPDARYTPQILDILKAHDVKATFFMLGSQVNRHPEIARRVVEEGHEIGNHTFTHPNLEKLSRTQLRMEVNATQRVIESVTGRATLLFRPPFAIDIEPRTAAQIGAVATVSDKGYYIVNMYIDGVDWWLAQAGSIADRVIEGARSKEGHVILLHDAGGNRRATIEALPQIIETLKAEGFRFGSVAELLGKSRDDLMPKVDPQVDPFLKVDTFGYAVMRFLERAVAIAFAAAIALGLFRTALVVLLALRRRSQPLSSEARPLIGVVVPAFNEEKVICHTIASLLKSDWRNLIILVVDDGSTDRTAALVRRKYGHNKRVRLIRKPNGGKPDALNIGFAMLQQDIIVALDADTIFLPDTISKLVRSFSDPRVGAVAGNAKVGNRINLLTRWQALEYIIAQNLDRRAFERLNCISVVPGAVGAWRREAVLKAGGFQSDTLAEDADLTLRVIQAGYKVVFDDQAIALTEAPADVRAFLKQRFRWTFGMLQTAFKHKGALFSRKPNSVGLVAVPNILIYQLLFPCLAPVADLLLVLALAGAGVNAYFHPDFEASEGIANIVASYFVFVLIDYVVAIIAFLNERGENRSLLAWLFLQRFIYRQLLYYVALKAVVAALRGGAVGWFKLERKASVPGLKTS